VSRYVWCEMSDIIKKQQQSLVQTIKECEKSELTRMKRLSLVTTSGERSVLQRRFEQERSRDQERIENLSKDFFTLQEKAKSGTLGEISQKRSVATVATRMPDGHNKNRFVGLENHNDIIFHAAVCDKFGKYDHRFQEKMTRPVFNAVQEHQKLKLLSDKRTLLKQLVHLHVLENGGSVSTGRSTSQSNYARSESNYSRDSDRASYATFATGRSAPISKPPVHVPKLGI
jgi:hypothetical protein